ncbi:unnamed protein product [Sphagnum jensenii]|uniref:beta-carotene 3-hydroxylase n=1 Tax=Sphagnum jensenii TaxID=128206 RepID=A0ABP0WJF6_9BRYO
MTPGFIHSSLSFSPVLCNQHPHFIRRCFYPLICMYVTVFVPSRRRSSRFVCMVADERNSQRQQQQQAQSLLVLQQHKGELLSPRKRERTAYLVAAITSSIGFVTLAAGAVYYRFIWQMQGSGEVPYAEMMGTFSLAIGAAVGMEFWARWAHRALWHASLWNMHESHHKPREGPFELNDIFAIINAVPAITLMAFGFFNHGFVPGLCFGGGLGITMFGMAYMFVHDGLVHRRFAVGPVADFPYLQKVAAAHQLHHADLFGGIPYGLFLGPKELEEVGGQDELEKVLNLRYKIREGEREG